MASDTYSAGGGPIAAVVNAAWATAARVPSAVDWLPQANTPLYPGGPVLNVVWYRFFRTLAERVAINGPSTAQITSSISAVQGQVLDASSSALSASSQAAANTASIDAIREVTINAGLPGAGQIP